MKASLPLLILTLAISTTLHASSFYSPPDDDVEKAISATLFSKMDSNSDSKVSLDEIYTFRFQERLKREEERANEIMKSCDINTDGQISGDEIKEFSMDTFNPEMNASDDCRIPAEIIEMMDLNGDGAISKKEIIEGTLQHRRPPKKIRERIEAKISNKNDERMKKYQLEQFVRCDTDKDQYLTLREAASMKCSIYTEMFDARDKDNDSLISEEEMMATVKSPRFDLEPGISDYDSKLPPEVSLSMKMSACDKNENGQLELDETATKACEVDLNYFNSVDHNDDGAIEHSEIERLRMKKTFDELDKNKDGYLDKNEFRGSRIRYM